MKSKPKDDLICFAQFSTMSLIWQFGTIWYTLLKPETLLKVVLLHRCFHVFKIFKYSRKGVLSPECYWSTHWNYRKNRLRHLRFPENFIFFGLYRPCIISWNNTQWSHDLNIIMWRLNWKYVIMWSLGRHIMNVLWALNLDRVPSE